MALFLIWAQKREHGYVNMSASNSRRVAAITKIWFYKPIFHLVVPQPLEHVFPKDLYVCLFVSMYVCMYLRTYLYKIINIQNKNERIEILFS
jgi:hypothetical protein